MLLVCSSSSRRRLCDSGCNWWASETQSARSDSRTYSWDSWEKIQFIYSFGLTQDPELIKRLYMNRIMHGCLILMCAFTSTCVLLLLGVDSWVSWRTWLLLSLCCFSLLHKCTTHKKTLLLTGSSETQTNRHRDIAPRQSTLSLSLWVLLFSLHSSLSQQISHDAQQLTPFFECFSLTHVQSMKGSLGNAHVLGIKSYKNVA